MMKKVCVVTATRAEYGWLRPLLFRLDQSNEVDLQLVVTGTHLCSIFGNTQKEIEQDGFRDYFKVLLPLDDDSKEAMAISTGISTQKFAKLFSELLPDIVVILGDRFEMLGVATAAHLMGIPIAHICGGDVTEGAVDDAIRHCITKLSFLHFPGCEESANRIIQMGESPDRVFNVGEPGIENCVNMKLLLVEDLANEIGFKGVLTDYCVVTFHPVTMENNTAERQVRELIMAMDQFPNMSYIITKANADAGGRIINEIWDEEAKNRKNWYVTFSLGIQKYLSAVKSSKLVIGNSSSGLVEVPALKVPTINIGNRQKGRLMAKSVICCEPELKDIVKAMNKGLSQAFKESIEGIVLPYGDGRTSEKILREIMHYLNSENRMAAKIFYNIVFQKE